MGWNPFKDSWTDKIEKVTGVDIKISKNDLKRYVESVEDFSKEFVHNPVDAFGDLATNVWKESVEVAEFVFHLTAAILEPVMALLGIEDEKVIATEVSTFRLMPDDKDLLKDIRVAAVLANQRDGSGFRDNLTYSASTYTGIFSTAFNSARNGDLIDGFPTSEIQSFNVTKDTVKTVIDTHYNVDATVVEALYRVPRAEELVKFIMQEHDVYQYEMWSGQLWYNGEKQVFDSFTYNETTKVFDVVVKQISNSTIESTIQVYAPDNKLCYIAVYYTTNSAEWKLFMHYRGSSRYPEMEQSGYTAVNLKMMPVMMLRSGTVNANSDVNSERYISTSNVMRRMGLDMDSLIDTLADNPDIDQVEDAFVHFAVSPSDMDPIVSKYLYKFFSSIEVPESTGDAGFGFTLKEEPMNVAMVWTDQWSTVDTGVKGEVGSYSHAFVDVEETTEQKVVDSIVTSTETREDIEIYYQHSATEYTTIHVRDLSSTTFVDRGGEIGTTVFTSKSEKLTIPLSYSILRSDMTPLEHSTLVNYSLRMSVYSASITVVDYYYTGAFQVLVQIVIVVITVVSTISSGGTATQAAIAAGKALLIQMAVGAALKLVFKETDNKYIRAIAVIAAVVVSAQAGNYTSTGEFMSASQLIASVTEFTATNFAVASNVTAQLVNELVVSPGYEGLAAESKAFYDQLKEVQDTHTEMMESFNTGLDINAVLELNELGPVEYYLTSNLDAMMYQSRDIQFDFDRTYDTEPLVGSFVDDKLRLS